MPSKEEAQEMFDRLMNFGTTHLEIPTEVLEALDVVANYCGDIVQDRLTAPRQSKTSKKEGTK